MNLSLDRSKDGSTQVLPQFRDTKLGNLRLWTAAGTGTRPNMEQDWRTITLYIVVNVVCFTASIVLLVPLSLYTAGWIMFGVWGFLSLLGIASVILLFIRSRAANSKLDSIELENMETKIDVPWKIPIDPVMDRAIKYLVYHGQDDCEDCRLLRFRDEFERRVQEWSKAGPAPDVGTYSYATVPTRTSHVTSFAGKPASTQLYSGYISSTGTDRSQMKKEHPIIRHASIVSTDNCDDTDTDDDIFDDDSNGINANFNNNVTDSSRMMPTVVITPPDVTMENPLDRVKDNFDACMTSSHLTMTEIDDVTLRSEFSYQKKPTRRTGTSRNGVLPRHSSVSKRRRGPVQKSLQRMKGKSYLSRYEPRKQNSSQKTTSLKSHDFITSQRQPYDVTETRNKDVVVSVESSL